MAPALTSTAAFNEPRAIAVGPTGNLNVMDTVNQRIVQMTPTAPSSTPAVSAIRARLAELAPQSGCRPGHRRPLDRRRTKQSRLQIFPARCSGRRSASVTGQRHCGQFYWPYAIGIRNGDRLAFVADT